MSKIAREPKKERAQIANFRPDNKYARACIAQDAGLSPQMILDLSAAKWRIDRDRNAASVDHPEERFEESRLGRQHNRDTVARGKTFLQQSPSDAAGGAVKVGIGDALLIVLAPPQQYVGTAPMLGNVIVERFD